MTAGYLSVAKFANEPGLQRQSGNRWLASPTSGGEVVGTDGREAAAVAPERRPYGVEDVGVHMSSS